MLTQAAINREELSEETLNQLSQYCLRTNFNAPNPKFLLVTSAWHMKRSMGCYSKAKINVTAFAVDSQVGQKYFHIDRFMPNPNNFGKWQILIHEVFGFITYKASGYL